MVLDGHLQIVAVVHVASAFDQAFNDQQAFFLLGSADQAPNQLFLSSCDCHKRRSVNAVDALLNHKDALAALKIFD